MYYVNRYFSSGAPRPDFSNVTAERTRPTAATEVGAARIARMYCEGGPNRRAFVVSSRGVVSSGYTSDAQGLVTMDETREAV